MSVLELHNFYAAPARCECFDAAPVASAPTLPYSNTQILSVDTLFSSDSVYRNENCSK
jgi:hypothetical protein